MFSKELLVTDFGVKRGLTGNIMESDDDDDNDNCDMRKVMNPNNSQFNETDKSQKRQKTNDTVDSDSEENQFDCHGGDVVYEDDRDEKLEEEEGDEKSEEEEGDGEDEEDRDENLEEENGDGSCAEDEMDCNGGDVEKEKRGSKKRKDGEESNGEECDGFEYEDSNKVLPGEEDIDMENKKYFCSYEKDVSVQIVPAWLIDGEQLIFTNESFFHSFVVTIQDSILMMKNHPCPNSNQRCITTIARIWPQATLWIVLFI